LKNAELLIGAQIDAEKKQFGAGEEEEYKEEI